MKGARPNAADYEGHPAASRPALTNDLCGQYAKVKINLFISALAKVNTNAVLILTF